MRKAIMALLLIGMGVACTQDTFDENLYVNYVPETLAIKKVEGLKLENYIVENEVRMNVKLTNSGTYRLRILDIEGKTVSQEKLSAKEGDNILKTYTSALDNSSYTVVLETENGNELGREIFSNKK